MERALRILNWLLGALAAAFGAATLWVQVSDCPYQPVPTVHERYRPALFAVNSVDAAMAYLPNYYKSPNPTPREKVEAVNGFVQDRFFHGVSFYRPCDNWVANLSGYAWDNLAMPVLPDDILKYRRALCSQQAIVAQAMLKRLGIHYASVSFDVPGHFAPAAQIDGTWYFFDPDLERPSLTPVDGLRKPNTLELLYPGQLGRDLRRATDTGHMHFRNVDSFPGPRGAAFDVLTNFVSHFGWAVLAALWLLLTLLRRQGRLRRRDRAIDAEPPASAPALDVAPGGEPLPVRDRTAA